MRWSPEVRVLMNPAAAFRELTAERAGGAWVMLRRPLLLALVAGCTVSLQASGRLSTRLVADGIVSFAFLPFFEIVALAVVYARGPRRVPFARAADAFFAANAPWLVWLLAFAVVRCAQTPLQATARPAALLTLELSPFHGRVVGVHRPAVLSRSAPAAEGKRGARSGGRARYQLDGYPRLLPGHCPLGAGRRVDRPVSRAAYLPSSCWRWPWRRAR